MPFTDRARKNEKVILSALVETGQAVAATCMGVNESTVSRMKNGDIEHASKLLAAIGLKVVPIGFHCYPEEEIEALRILARRSDVLRADNLEWID
jgi:choline kinase